MLQNRRSPSARRQHLSSKRRQLKQLLKSERGRALRLENLEKRELLAGDLELIAISPNFGSFITDGSVLSERPRELTLRFTPGESIDPATLGAIQIIGSGFDGSFADGNEVTIQPGFLGLGETADQVLFRFAQSLPDDLYQVTITGSGATPLANISGEAFNAGTDLTLQFDLDLGATVQAVVPQPVVRDQVIRISNAALPSDGDTLTIDDGAGGLIFEFDQTDVNPGSGANIPVNILSTDDEVAIAIALASAINGATFNGPGISASAVGGGEVVVTGGALTPTVSINASNVGSVVTKAGGIQQLKDIVVVYFNEDDLSQAVAEDIRFYRLVNTSNSLDIDDDAVTLPQSVAYDANNNRAILTFASDIPSGTFRLRVGTSDESNGSIADAVNVGTLFDTTGYLRNAVVGDQDGVDDVDFYKVDLVAGAGLIVTVDGDVTLDAALRLFDSAGTPLVVTAPMDFGLGGVESFTFTAAAAGTFYVGVSSQGNEAYSALDGSGNVGGGSSGSYQLRMDVTNTITLGNDDNSSFSTATQLGVLGSSGQTFGGQIQPQGIALPQYPGGSDEPGHREIPAESHGAGAGTAFSTPGAIRTVQYHFPNQYGTNPQGLPLFNQITPNQRERAREIFEIFASKYGFEVRETVSSGIPIITGDIRAFEPTYPVGISLSTVLISGAGNYGSSPFGGGWFGIALHEIGHAIGITHSYDIPSFQGGSGVAEDQYPGNHDIVHGRRINRPDATDIDLYQFDVPEAGTISAEIVAERLPSSSLLDSALRLYRQEADGSRTLVAQNDDYFSDDAYIELPVDSAGTYFLGVSSTGNMDYDPVSSDTGFGGLTDGAYNLKLNFRPAFAATSIVDQTGMRLDGDADGKQGGTFEFSFRSDNTLLVDKSSITNLRQPLLSGQTTVRVNDVSVFPTTPGFSIRIDNETLTVTGINPTTNSLTVTRGTPTALHVLNAAVRPTAANGSESNPFGRIQDAVAVAASGDIIRVVANAGPDNVLSTVADNRPYLVGLSDSLNPLEDGSKLEIPKNVVLQIDPGAIIKLQSTNINAGSTAQGVDRGGGAVQVLGTPNENVILTAYGNDAIGGDSDGVTDGANPGDWGGIVFRDDSDFVATDATTNVDDRPITLNYVNQANISFGGGLVSVNGARTAFTPLHMVDSRPTISYNTIRNSAQGAISADPDSFSDSRGRIGPDIVGNFLSNNTTNGVIVRFDSSSTGGTAALLTKTARFDDDDIVHVLTDNLAIAGNAGGPINPANPNQVLPSGRLAIDPGIVVKLSSARIEGRRGASNLIAEGTPEDPIIFTSLLDDRFGVGGTFDTTGNGSTALPAPGDWSGLVFNAVSSASIDNALISYAGGESPIAGGLSNFNTIEAHHGATLRLANSTLQFNANGNATDNRDARGTNTAATIFVRQAQPVILNNIFADNDGSVIDINVNAMLATVQRDPGRSSGPLDVGARDGRPTLNPGIEFADNRGPLVRLNRFADNEFNGMTVRGGQLSTESVWDDTDIVHIVRDEIIVDHHHTFSGLRLQSAANESLVIKLQGNNAGFTADGVLLDIDDRIGGTVQVIGRPSYPVVMTSLDDCTVGAGLTPDGFPHLFTNGLCSPAQTVSADVIDIVLALDDTTSFQGSGTTLISVFPQIVADLQAALPGADFAFSIVRFEEYAAAAGNGTNLRPFILNQPVVATTTPGFQSAIDAALARVAPGTGTNADETYIEALLQIATGIGFDGNGDGDVLDSGVAGLVSTQTNPTAGGDVPDIGSFVPDPTGDPNGPVLPPDGTIGGVGFRPTSTQRIVLLGTDGNLNVQDDGMTTYTGVGGATVPVSSFTDGTFGTPGGRGATIQNTVDQLIANNIKVIGLGGRSGFGGPNDVQTPLTALATLTGANDFLGSPLYFDIDPDNGSLIANAIVQAVTGVVPGLVASPGDWRGLQFNPNSNDRNVRTILENESATTSGFDINNDPASSQVLGELAKNLKSGDDNRALGFEVHGFISADDPGDVDVYSFNVDAGTEVWIDLDRTRGASLDSKLELIRQDETVLATSTGINDPGDLSGLALPLEKFAYDGGDFYTLNYQDAGMRVILPGTSGGPNETYYVRVSSEGGLTNGEYQLQIRLRQTDEKPGSIVQHADIRFANNGIEVIGLPSHSPLLGESAEIAGDNNGPGGAQPLGNQLESDRNTISVAGSLSANDVDFFQFTSDYATTIFGPSIQAIGAVNGGPKTWSTVFDIDYADGLTRADSNMVVFQRVGDQVIPVLIGRESNVSDDQPGAGLGINLDDLSRGSAGQLDPFIGPVQLPTGTPGTTTEYFVGVFTNAQLLTQLNQTYFTTASNPLVRLEPINSVTRIAEDHIGLQGYDSNGTSVDPRFNLFDITDATTLSTNVRALDLSDVPLYISSANRLETYDALSGAISTDLGALSGAGNFQTRDIVMRSDGTLWGYQRVNSANNNDNGTAGRLVQLNPANGAVTVVGNDEVLGIVPTPAVNAANNTNPSFAEITFTDDVEALAWERSGGVGNAAQYALYYSVSENGRAADGTLLSNSKLYRANPDTGSVARNQTNQTGVRGDLQPAGVTYAFGNMTVDDGTAPTANIRIEARVPGAAGNGITINVTRADATTQVTSVTGSTINLTVDDTPNATAQAIVDAINSHGTARTLVTAAITSGATNEAGATVTGTVVLGGGLGTPLRGNVTGLSFGQFHGDASLTSNATPLYGVTDAGEFITINTANGQVSNVIDFSVFGLFFEGLTLGPQNLNGGALQNTLVAVTTNGILVAFDPATGNFVPAFNGSPLSFTRTAATGLAFSPADFNLWHPTTRRGAADEPGHGINPAFDFSRTPEDADASFIDAQGNAYALTQQQGGISMYFGLEEYVDSDTQPYLNYHDTRAQSGVLFNDYQRDLTSGAFGGTYDLPGGSYGSLITNPFDLTSVTSDAAQVGDRPTLYFNYFLNSEDRNTNDADGTARDTARVFVTNDGGNSWSLLATNNTPFAATGNSGAPDVTTEVPDFVSHLRSADQANPRQEVQPLFDNTGGWRQARIDLSEFAGQSNLQFRFDFSTAGTIDDGVSTTETDAYGNLNDVRRGQNNAFEGFYVDDIIVGWSERGETITAATNDTSVFGVPQDPDPLAPVQSLAGPYQLEIRRGHEFGAIIDPIMPEIGITTTFDPNTRFIPGGTLGTPAAADDFETGDFSGLGWRASDGDSPWTVVDNSPLGTFEAQSGLVNTNQRSDLTVTVTTGAGFLVFDRLFTPDPGGNDRFQVFIDGGVIAGAAHEVSSADGADAGFQTISVPVDAGVHTFNFVYRKNATGTDGVGSVLIDNVFFPNPAGGAIRGDRNLLREQGHFQIEGNIIRDVRFDAINIVAGPRDPITGFAHPGSPIQFETRNTDRHAPGVTVSNNVITRFGSDAISVTGDSSAGPAAAVPLGKFIHNTIYGGAVENPTNGTVGIRVENNANPTMLNNIIVNTETGVSVDASSSGSALARTYFRGNSTNTAGITNSLPIADNPANLLFVNPSADNFYLAGDSDQFDGIFDGALPIDRSLSKIDDRTNFVAVKADLGIPVSDVISPSFDRFRQTRVDDPLQPPSGVGSEVFSDVGAIERGDFLGPIATLFDPLDNSVIDLNPLDHDAHVIVANFLTRLVVQLNDSGIGIDDTFVRSSQWELRRNGVLLNPGVDYTFIYNFSSDQVIFQSLTAFASDSRYTITVTDRSAATGVRDLAGNLLGSNRPNGDVRFEIVVDNGRNDAPVNVVPPTATTPEDTALIFSTFRGNAISVSDPDAALGTNELTVTLVSQHGTAVPRTIPGVTVTSSAVAVTPANRITVGTAASMIGQSVAVGDTFFRFVDNAVVTTPGPTDVPVDSGDGAAAVATALAAVLNDSTNFGAATATAVGSTVTVVGLGASNASDPAIVLDGATLTTPDGASVIGSRISVGGKVFTYVDIADVTTPAAQEIAVTPGDLDTTVAMATATVLNTVFAASTATTATNVVTLAALNTEDSIVTLTGDVALLNQALNGLRFLPDSNYVGPASLTINSEDNGNFTFFGDINPRDLDVINIQVTPINDAPTLDAIPDQVIAEDTALLTVSLAGINGGQQIGTLLPNETEQVRVTASSSDTSRIPNPTATYSFFDTTGSIDIAPLANAFGDVTITVTVEDAGLDNDFSTTADNLTFSRSFVVTLTPSNDIPTLDAILDQTIDEDTGPGTVALTGITAGLGGETEMVRLSATSDNTAVVLDPSITYVTPNTTATLSYDLVADAFETVVPITITVLVEDAGPDNDFSTAGDNLTFTRTFEITVNPVNDLPEITPIADESHPEDGGPKTVSLTGINNGAANEFEPVVITATSSDPTIVPNPVVSYTDPDTTGSLVYNPVPDRFGTVTISVRLEDGGLDGLLSTTGDNGVFVEMFNVTITEDNDLPEIDPIADQMIDEDTGPGTVSLAGITNGSPFEDDSISVSATSSDISIVLDPVITYTSGDTAGTLTYTLVPHAFGTATITVLVRDAGIDNVLNTLDDGVTPTMFDIVVNPVNDLPTLDAIANQMIDEDTGPGTVNLTGIDNGPANETENVRISAVSSNPLIVDTVSVAYNSLDPVGVLTYTLAPNAFGGPVTITVTVEDAGLDGIFDDTLGNESADNATITRTFEVLVKPVNDAPEIDAVADFAVDEDTGPHVVNLSGITAGPGGESQPIKITVNSSDPTLIPAPTIAYTSPATTGTLTFSPVANCFGAATISVFVQDGGADGNLLTLGDNLTTLETFVVTVNPVNDPPQLTALSDRTILEDAALQTVALTGINAGPNETQVLRVTATSDNPTLISNTAINYTSPNATGTLTYSPNLNEFGMATITVTVEDGGDDNDLATTGDNLTFDRSFVVTVDPVNDVPTITPIANLTILEDAAEQIIPFSGVTAGGGESQPIRISATSTNLGLIANPVVTYSSPDMTGSLAFTPVADRFGTTTIRVTLEDGGLDQNLSTAADNGTFVAMFVVTVDPVNDLPTLAAIPTQTSPEDAGPQTVALTGITTGAVNESQPLRLIATSGDPTLVADPTISYTSPSRNATLTYTSLPDRFGSTTITVQVEDGGLDRNLNTSGDNGTSLQTFLVIIDPVNDPPTIDDPADVVIDEDSAQQTVSLSGITAGPFETEQVRVSASSDKPGLIPNPSATYAAPGTIGSLMFTPVLDQFGVATITVTVEDSGLDDDFSTSADNLTFSETFTITVNNLPDPPRPVDDTVTTSEDTLLVIDAAELLANDEDPDLGPTSPEVLSVVMPAQSFSDRGATVSFNAATGEVTYDPSTSAELQALAPGESLPDSFVYSVTDADGETVPPSANVNLTVTGVNDPPSVRDDVASVPHSRQPAVIRPLDNDVDVDGMIDENSIIITKDPTFGSVAKRVVNGVLELAYSPFPSFTGNDSFRYTVADNLGQQSDQATVRIVPNVTPKTTADAGGGVATDVINIPVLANDLPVQGQLDIASLTIVSGPTNGQAIKQSDGTITYVPNTGFLGTDTFRYTIADTLGNVSVPTKVTVKIVASGLENPIQAADVDASGTVTSLDALLVINKLARGGGQSGIAVQPDDRGPGFYDVDGSMTITALDALLVINFMGKDGTVLEGEFVDEPIIADGVWIPAKASQSVDTMFQSPAPLSSSGVEQKLVDVGTANLVDASVVDLLAEAHDSQASDESESESLPTTLNDLAILDLL